MSKTVFFLYFLLFLLHNRSNRISNALHTNEEGLGTTKLQEHVQTYGYMILIISNVEIDDALILALLILLISQT